MLIVGYGNSRNMFVADSVHSVLKPEHLGLERNMRDVQGNWN
jgi:hypothetical protein